MRADREGCLVGRRGGNSSAVSRGRFIGNRTRRSSSSSFRMVVPALECLLVRGKDLVRDENRKVARGRDLNGSRGPGQ